MRVDLRSDTVTKPTEGMLHAMFASKVGDDVFGDDPSVNALQQQVASLFGKEAALFFPSGTMANQVAIKTHVQPGDEIICDQTAHVYRSEGGGIAATSGASVRLLNGERGIFTATDVLENINPDDAHCPKSVLLCVENTVNKGGGACWSKSQITEVCEAAKSRNLNTHLDGARLWNAMVKTNLNAAFFGENFDSISVCFSKGLGCPVGSVLVGSKEFIHRAHRHRKRLGGGMRQIGYLAAACSYALENHLYRLQQDHLNATKIAEVLSQKNWVKNILPVETNIVIFKLGSASKAAELLHKLRELDIHATDNGGGWLRFVLHLDIDENQLIFLINQLQNLDF
ncbi:MAG: aminotransferase class I/II-fold pyridoxal phosphate-dependent enzyme [Bacteroidetes bacterium]|nr:aminotransferase class I/II-fold pyridoxal phosphate-dependent enzyme [Bacteroidota bacterium]